MPNVLKLAGCTIAAVFLVACAESTMTGNSSEYLDSLAVTTKIKATLLDQLGSQSTSITVRTYRDEVQLGGVVNSVKTRQAAGAIAASIAPTSHVRNDLSIQ